MTYVMKISKKEKDANTSVNHNDFILESPFNGFKIIESRAVDITVSNVANRDNNVSITHTVKNPVAFLLYVKFPDGKVSMVIDATSYDYDLTGNHVRSTYIASNSIKFIFYKKNAPDAIISARYYIFETPP